ncbi:choice-of-anchor Q domain-containing protein [Wenzhouxiangellaceae bacterium CH-27]|uniref:Choice-of-anchor Q domain-containing protein n=1 Tax=Elongatibacter sediminis TaxID=3119006 RepID=A0AAW9RMJ9_9GAMM
MSRASTFRQRASWLILLAGCLASSVTQAGLCLVDKDAAGANNGTTWEDAYTHLAGAMLHSHCDELWVAGGTYTPTDSQDPQGRFILQPGIEVYGGFAGTETEREQRDPRANPTILSGDLGDGIHSIALVFFEGFDHDQDPPPAPQVLDGFTVTGGVTSSINEFGAGIYIDAGTHIGVQRECNPILRNLIIEGNAAGTGGGGVFIDATIDGFSSPIFENVTFINNTALSGAAMYIDGHGAAACPTLNNVTFVDNHAEDFAGGILLIQNVTEACLVMNNATFSGNTSGISGSAITISAEGSTGGTPTFNNIIVWGNPTGDDKQFADLHPVAEINNSVIESGCPTGSTCNNLVSTDPFLGALGDHGGLTPTMPISKSGSAFDAGDDATCLPTDQRGVPRPQGEHCDIGAYEKPVGFFADGFESAPPP